MTFPAFVTTKSEMLCGALRNTGTIRRQKSARSLATIVAEAHLAAWYSAASASMFYFTAEALWRPLMSLNDSACNIAMQEEDHGGWAVQSESQTEADDEVHRAYDNALDSRTERVRFRVETGMRLSGPYLLPAKNRNHASCCMLSTQHYCLRQGAKELS